MTTLQRRVFAALIAIACILGFAYLYGKVLYDFYISDNYVDVTENYKYVATVLAGLVGGVVAMVFNENLPDISPQAVDPKPEEDKKSGFRAGIKALTNSIKFSTEDVFRFVTAAYVCIYFVMIILAIAGTISRADSPELVKNVAMIGFGLFVAIARTFLNIPKQ